MLPPLPFYGRELAALVRAALPRLVEVLVVLAALATVVVFVIVFGQLLTIAPPRIG